MSNPDAHIIVKLGRGRFRVRVWFPPAWIAEDLEGLGYHPHWSESGTYPSFEAAAEAVRVLRRRSWPWRPA